MHAPELARLPLELSGPLGAPLAVFCRATSRLGEDLVLKAAWSEEAAANLLLQARLLRALDPIPLPIQRPVLVAEHPVLVVHRRLPGGPLSWEVTGALDSAGVERVAGLLAGVLATLHGPETRALVDGAQLGLPAASRWCQASPERLRRDLAPRLAPPLGRKVRAAADWAEAVLARRPEGDTFVHGDFHGWNLLVDGALERIEGVLDFESASLGDPEFDFRYLVAMAPTAGLFEATVRAYPAPLDRERILAWHLLTDLGDALWRTEQGAWLDLAPLPRRVGITLDRAAV